MLRPHFGEVALESDQRKGQRGSWGEVLLPLPGPLHTGTRTPGGGREGRQAWKAQGPGRASTS